MSIARAMDALDGTEHRTCVVDAFLRMYGKEASPPPDRSELSRKRAEAGKQGASKREANRKQTEMQNGSKIEANRSVLPHEGDKGGDSRSDLPESDPDITSPKPSLSEKAGAREDSEAAASYPSGDSRDVRGASPRASAGNDGSQSAGSTAPVALPPRRLNPVALIDAFSAGVNSEDGVWPTPTGKPSMDLAAALNAHARKAVDSPTKLVEALGARWFRFCGGAPRDAWKAAAWLGEGAPEKPGAAPQNDAQAHRERSELAKARERDQERLKRQQEAVRPPPEVLAMANGIGLGGKT
jgi:hypothetical protein